MRQVGNFKSKPYHSKRLEEYATRMSQDNNNVLYDDHVAKVLSAQGYSVDESPRSIYSAEKLFQALEKFSPGRIPKPKSSQAMTHGIALARASFARKDGSPKLHVMSMTPLTVATITSKPSASAGLTNFGCSKAESQTRALERGLQTLKGEKAPEPCIAYARTQFDAKTRLVWGFPYSMTLIEGLVAYRLNELFKGGHTPMAYSVTTMSLGTKLRASSYKYEWAYSIDMSSFDASIHGLLIHEAFKILKTWFSMDEVEPISGVKVGKIFDIIEGYFIHTPIVMPDKRLYIGKKHGVPSGSYFTQMIDSIVNVIIAGTISYQFHMNVDKSSIFVLGDDLLMWSNRDISLEAIAGYASNYYGVEFNPKKCAKFRYTEAIHYLGRDWENGIPNLPIKEVLKRMYYPERFRKYDKDPQRRERQVKLLLLSYAAVYRNGYSIARDSIWTRNWNKQSPGAMDLSVYHSNDGKEHEADPAMLSGLERYLAYYVRIRASSDMPHTAIQFWL